VIKNCRLEQPNSDCSYEAYVYFLSSRVPVAKLGASADPLRIEAGCMPSPPPCQWRRGPLALYQPGWGWIHLM